MSRDGPLRARVARFRRDRLRRQSGQHVLARLSTPIGDVTTEQVIEVLQRIATDGLVVQPPDTAAGRSPGTEVVAYLRPVLFGDAEQVPDSQRREGLAVLAEELASTARADP